MRRYTKIQEIIVALTIYLLNYICKCSESVTYSKPHGDRHAQFEKEKYFSFVHIPKCAGSSIIRTLKEVIPKEQFQPESEAGAESGVFFQHRSEILFKEEPDYLLIAMRSPIHHVWSQFTELKYDGWGNSITIGTEFLRTGDTPESDLADFELWLDHFTNPDGSFSKDPYGSKYLGAYSPVNMQARYLTSGHEMPHLVYDGDTFEPDKADAIDSYKKHDWVAVVEFLHESFCLFYYRLVKNNYNDFAQKYLDEKCTCSSAAEESLVSLTHMMRHSEGHSAAEESLVSLTHVVHHSEGHRSSLLELPPNIIQKIMKLTKIDRAIFNPILEDFMRDIVWLESKDALGRKVLCDEKLKKTTKELAYTGINISDTYNHLKKTGKNLIYSKSKKQSDLKEHMRRSFKMY